MSDSPVTQTADAAGVLARRADPARLAAGRPVPWMVFRVMEALGVYPPASQYEAWFPSLAHTSAHLDRTLDAVNAAFAELA